MTFQSSPRACWRPSSLLAPCSRGRRCVVVQNGDSNGRPVVLGSATTTADDDHQHDEGEHARRPTRVQSGRHAGAIAERRGVSVDQLQELNPDVDPQSLRAGSGSSLRE